MRKILGESIAREIDSKGARHQADGRFFGLFRGTCVDNVDDHGLRRIRVRVPEFYGEDPEAGFDTSGMANQDLPWAHPCMVPSMTVSPAVGDSVWVAFEKGDTNRPVWMGTYPTAPLTLVDAVISITKFVRSFFSADQTEGAIQPPPPAQSPIPIPPVSDLEKTKAAANSFDIDARFLWAIRLTENGRAGREFGVLNRKDATDFDGQARVSAETVRNTVQRYQSNVKKSPIGENGRYTDDFVKYFSHGGPGYGGYAPLGASNDPGNLNANHFNNLKKHYAATEFN